jgi:biotin carboxyl carrier protein
MENVIKSPGDCDIKEICVKEKASVEKGQILFRLLEK